MNETHTPGPWRLGTNYGAVVTDVEHSGVWCDAENRGAYGGNLVCESVHSKANALLIAAAPDLFSALTIDDVDQIIEAIENFAMGPVEDAELNAVWQTYIDKLYALRAAIAKAEGRP